LVGTRNYDEKYKMSQPSFNLHNILFLTSTTSIILYMYMYNVLRTTDKTTDPGMTTVIQNHLHKQTGDAKSKAFPCCKRFPGGNNLAHETIEVCVYWRMQLDGRTDPDMDHVEVMHKDMDNLSTKDTRPVLNATESKNKSKPYEVTMEHDNSPTMPIHVPVYMYMNNYMYMYTCII
jgi:hypothetical protein